MKQRAQIESGAPGDDGDAISREDFVESLARLAKIVSRRKLRLGPCDIKKVVRNAAPFGFGQFCRSNIEAAIDLNRIAVHNFAPELSGNLQREGGLSGAGWPQEHN